MKTTIEKPWGRLEAIPMVWDERVKGWTGTTPELGTIWSVTVHFNDGSICHSIQIPKDELDSYVNQIDDNSILELLSKKKELMKEFHLLEQKISALYCEIFRIIRTTK